MECSICYSEITSATGKVELSCSHPFHFSCLTTWFDKQKCQGTHENCPLCRHESSDFEKLPDSIYLEDEDEDEEDGEDEEDDWEEQPTLDELAAQERASGKFQKFKSTKTPEELQLYAANLIKACWRGYQDRLVYLNCIEYKERIDRHKQYILNVQTYLKVDLNRARFFNSTLGLSRYEVKMMAAGKIQAVWRRSRLMHPSSAPVVPLARPIVKSGVWQEISPGVWQRAIMNPEEDAPVFIGLTPPLSN